MKTENSVVYNCSKWKVIKELSKVNPNIWVSVFTKAFIIEAINLCNLTNLVITSQNGDSVLESDLQSNQ
jgi:hypothetical protein